MRVANFLLFGHMYKKRGAPHPSDHAAYLEYCCSVTLSKAHERADRLAMKKDYEALKRFFVESFNSGHARKKDRNSTKRKATRL